MTRLFTLPVLISLWIGTSSAASVSPENGSISMVDKEAIITSGISTKTGHGLTNKETEKISVADMERILGRKMRGIEKLAFKLNKRKFSTIAQMGEYGSTNALAIVSFVCAVTFILSPLAVIFGVIALGQIKRSGESGKGLAIAGIIIGGIFFLLSFLFIGSNLLWG